MLSASMGTDALGTPIPKKLGKEESAKAVAARTQSKASADAEEAICIHPKLQKWKNRGMKIWAINKETCRKRKKQK